VPRQPMLIDGEWRDSVTGAFLAVENPARRGGVIAEVPRATAADVDIAVGAAARAFRFWRQVAPRQRGRLMLQIAADVEQQAEDAPLTVLKLARICAEYLPAGVINVLTGYGEECGAPLAAHPGVAKVSFTGSTEVGRSVMRAASERIAPVSLELGGKSPAIVF